jgi:hypothetical protein
MDRKSLQVSLGEVVALAARQHGVVTRGQVVTRRQMLDLGLSSDAIEHRLRRGRLHRVRQGVYAVGRPQLTRLGTLLAAVLSCGPDAALSHEQAGEVSRIRRRKSGPIEVTVPPSVSRVRPGIRVHRQALRDADRTTPRASRSPRRFAPSST